MKTARFLGKAVAYGASESPSMKVELPLNLQVLLLVQCSPDMLTHVLRSSGALRVKFLDGISGNFPKIISETIF